MFSGLFKKLKEIWLKFNLQFYLMTNCWLFRSITWLANKTLIVISQKLIFHVLNINFNISIFSPTFLTKSLTLSPCSLKLCKFKYFSISFWQPYQPFSFRFFFLKIFVLFPHFPFPIVFPCFSDNTHKVKLYILKLQKFYV